MSHNYCVHCDQDLDISAVACLLFSLQDEDQRLYRDEGKGLDVYYSAHSITAPRLGDKIFFIIEKSELSDELWEYIDKNVAKGRICWNVLPATVTEVFWDYRDGTAHIEVGLTAVGHDRMAEAARLHKEWMAAAVSKEDDGA